MYLSLGKNIAAEQDSKGMFTSVVYQEPAQNAKSLAELEARQELLIKALAPIIAWFHRTYRGFPALPEELERIYTELTGERP